MRSTSKKQNFERKVDQFLERFEQERARFEKSHQALYAFMAGTGFIMFWYGISEGIRQIPVLREPVVSIMVGGGILLACGAYAYQFLGNKADEIKDDFTKVTEELAEDIAKDLQNVNENIETMGDEVVEVEDHVDAVEKRVEKVERVVARK